ncbi:hypothetical protein SLITO_v1c09080 [Spiroplasma litorale]|uniref:Phosphatidic acid phosphatase type 2/haloperoxidase domain-containing protein n=1 Tax=Spiroplasma litorale TaxID=216942 RepID=A0A0K1W2F9_9MOLU|nr:phosphatase PAP2 family protein [Spiroplasma litorale]AKX34519.1 hypothetical protein SLITO_v1c09080 [Spiroplasma litorale]
MALKKDRKLNKHHIFFIIMFCLLIVSIPLIIFDLKLSSIIPLSLQKNWFSIFFDQVGLGVSFIPIYYLLLIFVFTINFSFIKTVKNKKIIYIIFNIIFLCINIMFYYYNDSFNYIKGNNYSLITLISGLVCIIMSLTFYLVVNIYIYKKKLYKDIYWLSNVSKRSGYAFFVIFFSQITVQILKFIVGRTRPYDVIYDNKLFYYTFEINFNKDRGNSFPSGHTISAGLLFIFIFFQFLNNKRTKKLKIFTIVSSSLITMLVGISRITSLSHFMSDIYFSGVILFIYMYYSKTVVEWFRKKTRPRNI